MFKIRVVQRLGIHYRVPALRCIYDKANIDLIVNACADVIGRRQKLVLFDVGRGIQRDPRYVRAGGSPSIRDRQQTKRFFGNVVNKLTEPM